MALVRIGGMLDLLVLPRQDDSVIEVRRPGGTGQPFYEEIFKVTNGKFKINFTVD